MVEVLPGLRLVMVGTKDFALPSFEALLESRHPVVGLITQPDRPQGRKQELIPASIKQLALARGVPVHQPEDINATAGVALLKSMEPDLLVTAAYGQILSAEVLSIPRLGGINLHGSVLPRFRGAAPVARAIQSGEDETGVTVISMSPRVDAGGMIAVARTAIDREETAEELEARLARLGAPLVVEVVDRLALGVAQIIPQDGTTATKAPKLKKEEGEVDWRWTSRRVHDHVRALRPWPCAHTTWQPVGSGRGPLGLKLMRTRIAEGEGEPGRILEASRDRLVVAAGTGAVAILLLQVPGKRVADVEEFLRGYPVRAGDRMGPVAE